MKKMIYEEDRKAGNLFPFINDVGVLQTGIATDLKKTCQISIWLIRK
jgi:hypothetical protein